MQSVNPADVSQGALPLRIAIVGAGFAQHVHLPLLKADDRCEVVGLSASSVDKAARVAGQHGIAGAYGDYRKMFDELRPDAVTIAVPPPRQPEVIVAAAERGIHVFCEKPLGRDYAAAKTAVSAIQEKQLISAVDFSFPELETWKALKRIIAEGTLGTLGSFALTWKLQSYAHRMGIKSWKTSSAEGGGALNSLASHSLYYLEWLFGPIHRLRATLSPDDSETRAAMSILFASGLSGDVDISTDTVAGPGHILEVKGDAGAARLANSGEDYVKGFELTLAMRGTPEVRTLAREPATDTDGRFLGTGPIVERFISSVISGSLMSPDASAGLRVQWLMELARSSNKESSWVAAQ